MNYEQFLETKRRKIIDSGFNIDESKLNDKLFDFEKFCIKRALKVGKYAIFTSFC